MLSRRHFLAALLATAAAASSQARGAEPTTNTRLGSQVVGGFSLTVSIAQRGRDVIVSVIGVRNDRAPIRYADITVKALDSAGNSPELVQMLPNATVYGTFNRSYYGSYRTKLGEQGDLKSIELTAGGQAASFKLPAAPE